MEGRILLWVEDLKQGRSWVTLIVARKLVYLVKDEDRVRSTCLLQALDDTPTHRTDVGTTMATYLCFVMYTPEGDAHILTAEALCYASPQ